MTGLRLLLGLGGVILAGAVSAQDLAPGGDLDEGRAVANMCRTCHGLDGYARLPIAPHIGGEPASYLAGQLRAFRSGEREHEIMSLVAAGLSDAQIEDVVAWYAAQTVTAVPPPEFDAAAAPDPCATCHGADGIAVVEDAPNLAAEDTIYLETQLKAFRSGRRQHEVMSPIAEGLDDAEIRAVSEWYAAIGIAIAGP
jgi:cytochrome c553